MKVPGRVSALRLFGRLFQFSTVLTVNDCFLTSVLAYCATSPFTPAALLVLAPMFFLVSVKAFSHFAKYANLYIVSRLPRSTCLS